MSLPVRSQLLSRSPAGSDGHPSVRKSMHAYATVCLLRAGQLRRATNAAKSKSGQCKGQFLWDEYVITDVKGLLSMIDEAL